VNTLIEARTQGADQTRDLAAEIAALAKAGDIFLLAGEMGTGKTVWVQGFARGLGVVEQVTSPTFTLVHPYAGKQLSLLHADVYRLDRLSEVVDLGLIEQLDDRAVACIEWGNLAEAALPADFLEVRIDHGDGEEERTLTFRAVGGRWCGCLDALTAAVSPWADGR